MDYFSCQRILLRQGEMMDGRSKHVKHGQKLEHKLYKHCWVQQWDPGFLFLDTADVCAVGLKFICLSLFGLAEKNLKALMANGIKYDVTEGLTVKCTATDSNFSHVNGNLVRLSV